jgi:Ca-activated chloride channel family protein|tara:strand:+ start:762 stop:2612 length:1851 start_codon:yes stop_codon:yes gene_type:complete
VFDEFQFLRPLCLLAFLPLAALVHFWVKKTRGRSKWLNAINSELLSVLIEDNANTSGTWLKVAIIFALAVSVIGLAGPTWEKLPQNVEQKNDALVIILDLSLSMLAEDLKPSRMVKAKQKVIDILRLRNEGLTGLIAFAGDAHSVVPLTDDNATIENLLVALNPTMMPVFGSKPDHAMKLAAELFSNAGMQEGRVLIISDGIDDISAVSTFRNSAFPLSVIGVGTPQGAPIPIDLPGEARRYIKNPANDRVIVRLNEDNLVQVANQSFGRYARLSVGEQDISRVLSTSLPTEDASIKVEREFDTWADQGHWATLLLLPLLLMGFRRGVLACLPIALALQITPAPTQAQVDDTVPVSQVVADSQGLSVTQQLASTWDSAWLRGDQRGYEALAKGNAAKAAKLFEDPEWKAAAHYKNGDWQSALNGFGTKQDGKTQRSSSEADFNAAYNKGNALTHLGQYDEAIEEYDAALSINPNDEDAAFNKGLAQMLKEQQQQQEQDKQKEGEEEQQQQEGQDSSESSENDPNQEQESSEQEKDSDAENQDQPSEEEQQQQQEAENELKDEESEAKRDEKQEALEQWLRRVPDNPGGLLKRKFQYETKQRLRQGDYSNQQGEQIW